VKQLFFISTIYFFCSILGYGGSLWAERFELVPDVGDLSGPGRAKNGDGQNLHFFQFNDLWGYVDINANIIIEPTFAKADNFWPLGQAKVVDSSGKIGLIDQKGAWVTQPGLDEIDYQKNADDYVFLAKVGNFWGVIDNSGRWLIKPRFKKIDYLGQNLFGIKYFEKVGLFSPENSWLTKPIYEELSYGANFADKNNNLIKVKMDNKYGTMTSTGSIKINPEYDQLYQQESNIPVFVVKKADKKGVIDINNKIIVPFATTDFIFSRKKNEFWVEPTKGSYVAYSLTGSKRKLTMAEVWERVNDLKWKMAPCLEMVKRKEWGFCDNQGRVTIGLFEDVESFSDFGLAKVKKGGKFGYIDPKGKVVIDYVLEDGQSFYEPGIAGAKTGGRWGVINNRGGWLIKAEYESVSISPEMNLIVAKKGEKYSVFRKNGSLAYQDLFEDYRFSVEDKKLWVKLKGFWGLLDNEANWFMNPKFDEINYFHSNGMMPVMYRTKFALINKKYEFILYSDVACNQYVLKNGAGKVIWPKNALNCS
jgi:hypothetical protein